VLSNLDFAGEFLIMLWSFAHQTYWV